MFHGRGDGEVGNADPGMTATPPSPQFARATSDNGVDRNPFDQRKETISRSSLRGTQALQYLDSADLGAHRPIFKAGQIIARRIRSAKMIDQNRGVEDDAHRSKPDRRSASLRRMSSTYPAPSWR